MRCSVLSVPAVQLRMFCTAWVETAVHPGVIQQGTALPLQQ
jgi:hypothetical protein